MRERRSPDPDPEPWNSPGDASRVELVLYVSTVSPASLKAVSTLERVLLDFDGSQLRLEIRDVAAHARQAERDRVLFTPTLVKCRPEPRAWFVGVPDPNLASTLLLSCGLERRR
jgi:KaiB-like protein